MISACGVQRAYLYKSFHMRTITWGYGVHYLALCDVLAFCGWMLQGMRVVCSNRWLLLSNSDDID